jgi:hypothetical protein
VPAILAGAGVGQDIARQSRQSEHMCGDWSRRPSVVADKVQIALANMRPAGAMPYDWIVDFTRWQRKPRTFRDVNHALQETSDVPLMVARGYASLSFLSEAAEYMESEERPVYIYHFGDFEPSGVNAGEKIEQTLRELAPTAEIISSGLR